MRIEEVILRNLVQNDDYTRKVVPFLSNEYFHDSQERILFEEIAKHITKYNGLPTKETLLISLDALDTITEDQFSELSKMVSALLLARFFFSKTDLWVSERLLLFSLSD